MKAPYRRKACRGLKEPERGGGCRSINTEALLARARHPKAAETTPYRAEFVRLVEEAESARARRAFIDRFSPHLYARRGGLG